MIHLKVRVERSIALLITNIMRPCINHRATLLPDLQTSLARIEAGIVQESCSLVMLTGTRRKLTLPGVESVDLLLEALDLVPSVVVVEQVANETPFALQDLTTR